ncbi:unnamed protein product [Paramecium sonneborni]|uniref:FYVE-type domain-containing protein n=1 Tax=Paramecium sonneborni TaxID=65129 RepID=A0A8S1RJS3_9CILI|nr:unnamed protein product [Paramecium sonneborni]
MKDNRERSNTHVDSSGYEEIVKKYRSQNQNSIISTQLESIQEDEVGQSNFSIDQMEKDSEKCQHLRKSNDMDLVNQNDSIFQQTISDEKLKEIKQGKNECCICHKTGSLIHKLKQCKFCGNVICKEHGKKKRKDPSNNTKFRRLCDICEDKYIRLSVETTFKQKKDFLAQQALELDSESQKLLKDIRTLQNQVSEIQQQSVKKQGEYKQIQNELIFKTQKLENETKAFQEENLKLKQTIQSIKKELQQLNDKLNEKNLDSYKKQQLLQQIEQEIQSNDIECQKMMIEIEKLQLNIQSKKQKNKQQHSQKKIQTQKPELKNYQEYILTDDQPSIQQFNPYINDNKNLSINNSQNTENDLEPEISKNIRNKQKNESKINEEKSCCKIM